ncbi:MAG: N-6 DNA methylase [Bacteroidetes bacterium]|nr:MAG: N-6 DNA methylase [Bacteroidota bacterium]
MTSNHKGAIYTSPDFARLLADWAVRNPEDYVLDLGTGEGVFVFAAYQRLIQVGAAKSSAVKQIYGSEIDNEAFSQFQDQSKRSGLFFPNVELCNFFDQSIPPIDVIVGNPPYVRRSNITDVDYIRQRVREKIDPAYEETQLPRLSDLYVYFLLHAFSSLKVDGRVAVITADSWLSVGYGNILREYLVKHFEIERIISLDRRVFDNAQVKPVILMATKKAYRKSWSVEFVRIHNGLPVDEIYQYVVSAKNLGGDISFTNIKENDLVKSHSWGIHLKVPHVYSLIESHPLTKPISALAKTQIGYQTLAKDFFILSQVEVETWGIEERFLRPIAQSAKYFTQPVISEGQKPSFYVFYCSDSKEALAGTNALKYIEYAESKEVQIRGKDKRVVGYQNKDRIQKASRQNWYDLKTRMIKRGLAQILIPRLVYKNYIVYWNQAGFETGELLIEFRPKQQDTEEIYLAILNSTITEIVYRAHSQLYGGGTYNMNSGIIKKVPILDASLLNPRQIDQLKRAYETFIEAPAVGRQNIDNVIYKILGFSKQHAQQMTEVLEDLHLASTSVKKS